MISHISGSAPNKQIDIIFSFLMESFIKSAGDQVQGSSD
jgi:hypothetical protein